MSNIRNTIVLMILIVGVAIGNINGVYGETVWTEPFEPMLEQPLDKMFTITFNKDIDSTSLKENIIFVAEDSQGVNIVSGTEVYVKEENQKQVEVRAPLDGYAPDKEYYLFISDKIEGHSNQNLEQGIRLRFTTEENQRDSEFSFQGIEIGDSKDKLLTVLGTPNRKDMSKYGFEWYIYNDDYANYIQVGVLDGYVRGIYTCADNWSSKEGVAIGSTEEEVNSIYSDMLNYSQGEYNEYSIEEYKATIFFDKYDENRVTSILLLDKNINTSSNDSLQESFEYQLFDLANAIRVRNNKEPYIWDENIADTARKHSEDMAENNYFSHTNLEGKSPFDRMKEDGLQYSRAAENIAAGYSNAIFAHEAWMNSQGHRNNILGSCERLGVGVEFGGSYSIYYTQNFYTPR